MSTKKTAPTGANRPDTAMEGMMAGKYVLVTTEHRGVFLGELAESNAALRAEVATKGSQIVALSDKVRELSGLLDEAMAAIKRLRDERRAA